MPIYMLLFGLISKIGLWNSIKLHQISFNLQAQILLKLVSNNYFLQIMQFNGHKILSQRMLPATTVQCFILYRTPSKELRKNDQIIPSIIKY
jgi:hypothetical protein